MDFFLKKGSIADEVHDGKWYDFLEKGLWHAWDEFSPENLWGKSPIVEGMLQN